MQNRDGDLERLELNQACYEEGLHLALRFAYLASLGLVIIILVVTCGSRRGTLSRRHAVLLSFLLLFCFVLVFLG